MRSSLRYPLLLSGLAALLAASVAHADIYRWTDRNGDVVYSNIPPPDEQTARNLTLVTKATTTPVQPPPGPTQQELLARIQSLEQQVQAQSLAPVAVAAPAHQAPPVVHIQPAPQPVVAYYDSGQPAYDTPFSPFAAPFLPVTVVSVAPFRGRGHFARKGHGRDGWHGSIGHRGGGRGGHGPHPGGGRPRGR